jgi:hypothetical protein
VTYGIDLNELEAILERDTIDLEDQARRQEAILEATMDLEALREAEDADFPAAADCAACPWCEPALVGPAILALFEAAGPNLKALAFDGLRIARAGATSSNPGGLWVTDGGSWGDSVYFGRINADGTFRARREMGTDAREQARRLAAFGTVEIAAAGRRSGRCAYCARRLTDPVSIALGYGPVCAGYHGLPHGPNAVTQAA